MIAETSHSQAQIIHGAAVAEAIKREVAAEVRELSARHNFRPCLAVVRVGDDAASAVYVGNKFKTAQELGMISEYHALPQAATHPELRALVQNLNENKDVDGILVQLPLPEHLGANEILEAIDPEKDVDGFHPLNVGRLAQGLDALAPCTPAGIIELLERENVELKGKHAVVVGRSNIVGRPMAQMLLKKDATVTVCHIHTVDLAKFTSQADVLVVAVGKIGLICGEHIKPGATVIDVGINRLTDATLACELFEDGELEKRLDIISRKGATIIGDVHPREAMNVAGKITPVPGGVGLLTVAMLMKNTVTAAKKRRGILNF